jgi:hypothetical protein
LSVHFYPEYFGNGNPSSAHLHLSTTASTGHLGTLSQAYFFQHLAKRWSIWGAIFIVVSSASRIFCLSRMARSPSAIRTVRPSVGKPEQTGHLGTLSQAYFFQHLFGGQFT